MQLPPPLRRAIDEELSTHDPAKLRAAATRLSLCYREGASGAVPQLMGAPPSVAPPFARLRWEGKEPKPGSRSKSADGSAPSVALTDDIQRAAYLAVRMPATFTAVVAALGWTRQACGDESADEIHTMLDLGSGPGTALWAAAQVFPTLDSATAVERDPQLIEIARRLAAHADPAVLRSTHWQRGDLTASLPEGAWDLVVCSYALNELFDAKRSELIRRAWARTAKLLVVVEPGTTAGFSNILAARTLLLAASPADRGATLAAPCPNALDCPMAGNDWCHFAARIERTATHRRLKDATLGHEDEKFSYVAFSRIPIGNESQNPPSRIVRHPRIFSGYAQLTLCSNGTIAPATVTRSHKEDWRRLKRLGWGDRW